MRSLRDISIKTRLTLGFALAFGLAVAVGVIGLRQTTHISRAALDLQSGWLPRVERLGEIKRSVAQYRTIAVTQTQTRRHRQLVDLSNSAKLTKKAIDASLQAYAGILAFSEEKSLFAAFMDDWLRYSEALDVIAGRLESGDFGPDLQDLQETAATAFSEADAKLDRLLSFARAEAQETVARVTAANETALKLTAGLTGLSAMCVLGAMWWVGRHVTGPLLQVSRAMKSLAAGDLSVEAGAQHGHDEIGTLVAAVRGYRDSLAQGRAMAAQTEVERQRYRALVDASAAIVWRAAPDGSIVESSGWTEVTGQSYEEHLGHGWLSMVHPEDRDGLGKKWGAILSSGIPGPINYRVRSFDGTYRWFHARAACLRNDDGSIREWVGALTDITERKRSEDALIESEARYRLLADNTADVVVLRDLSGELLYISPSVTELAGYAPEELIGGSLDGLIHPDDWTEVEATRASLASGDLDRAIRTCRLTAKSGASVWAETSYRLVRDERGNPKEIIAHLRDVTERHKRQLELEEARQQAESASMAKSEFLAAMSHEIRTPLNGILGHTDLLLRASTLAPNQRRHAERIQTAGSALLTVVNDVLDFSSIEAGRVELELRAFSPAALVDNALSIVGPLAEKKRIRLDARIDDAVPARLVGDEDRLRQILLNLLNNAVKFTSQGGTILSLELARATSGDHVLRFAVADTGIGIPKNKLGLLFQRFSQVDGSIRRQFGGTGLGLAISKRIVTLMKGEIGVESEPGQGSTFWFTVPLSAATAETEPELTREDAGGGGRRVRILLVEDNDINQEIAKAVLESAGHEVHVALDGAVAVEAVQAKRFDLVLMDVQMPVMDGITATQHIRALGCPAKDVPIVAMTANVLPQQVQSFRAAGMNDHIGKPFKRAELFGIIEKWAGQTHRAA